MSLIKDWNLKQAAFRNAVAKRERFDEARWLYLELHGSVHSSDVSCSDVPIIFDGLD
jgi:hypothetical protein